MANNKTEEQRRAAREARRAARQTAQAKAARKETRQEYKNTYATDADRGLQGGSKVKRDQRKDAWAKDGFDLNTFGNQHVSGQEMKHMRKSGMSSADIEAKTSGMHMTARATKQLDRRKAREKAIAARQNPAVPDPATPPATQAPPETQTPPPGSGAPPATGTGPKPPGTNNPQPVPGNPPSVTPPGTGVTPPEPPGNTAPSPSVPAVPPRQGIGGDTGNVGKVGDMFTTIGDGNTIIGSAIGNDYSVTIGNTGNQDGGGGLSNMMGAAAYSALNNNAYAKSQSETNGYGVAAGMIALGEEMTGSTETVANLYNFAGAQQKYWDDKATAQQGNYLGDVQGGYDWTQAPNPVSSEDETDEILNG